MTDSLDRHIGPGDSASMTYGTAHRLHGGMQNMDNLSMTYMRAGNGLAHMVEDPYATRKQMIEDPYATRQQGMCRVEICYIFFCHTNACTCTKIFLFALDWYM